VETQPDNVATNVTEQSIERVDPLPPLPRNKPEIGDIKIIDGKRKKLVIRTKHRVKREFTLHHDQ
jgi:hypothetical protein